MVSLIDLKTQFTDITGLPAKKSSVLLVCDGFESFGMRSKVEWESAIQAIVIDRTPKRLAEIQEELRHRVEILEAAKMTLTQEIIKLDKEVDRLAVIDRDSDEVIQNLKDEIVSLNAQNVSLIKQLGEHKKAVTETFKSQTDDQVIATACMNGSDGLAEYLIEFYFSLSIANYREFSKLIHPDTNPRNQVRATQVFQIFNNVYSELKKEQGYKYDRNKGDQETRSNFNDIETIPF